MMIRSTIVFGAVGLMLAGCYDMTGADAITLRAGDAVHANAAIHTVDPQAHRAQRTHINSSGKYVAKVIGAYAPTTNRRPGGLLSSQDDAAVLLEGVD